MNDRYSPGAVGVELVAWAVLWWSDVLVTRCRCQLLLAPTARCNQINNIMPYYPPKNFAAKMPFLVRHKVQISSQIVSQVPQFANFVKFRQNQYFRHDGQFSSFRQFFVKNEILWSLTVINRVVRKSQGTCIRMVLDRASLLTRVRLVTRSALLSRKCQLIETS